MELNEETMQLKIKEHGNFAERIEVKNEMQLHEAGDYLVGIKTLSKEVEAWFAPMIDAAHKAHRAICDKKNLYLKPLSAAEVTIKGKIGSFQMELDRIREDEERKAREAAEKEAEKQRASLLAKAEKAAVLGNKEKADELLNAASEVYVAAAPVMAGTVKPAGIGVRYEFIPEITDKKAVPDDYKIVDLAALKKTGNATKDNPPTIAGVRWVKRPVVSGRTK